MKDRKLYSIDETRELLGGISRTTIYQLIRHGELASVEIGRRRFISAIAISDFIGAAASPTRPPVEPPATRNVLRKTQLHGESVDVLRRRERSGRR